MINVNTLIQNLPWTWILLILIVVHMIKEYRRAQKILMDQNKNPLPSGYFQKIGMIGTMIGLILVFIQFDDGNILNTIPNLGFAVLSTLAGIIFDLNFSRVISENKAEDNNENITSYLQEISKGIKDTRLAIANTDDESSLLSQIKLSRTEQNDGLKNLNNSFNSFAENMAKNNTDALIKAVQEVMDNFNKKINDNLGETFKRLNTSVENLVLWQDQYKNHLEVLQSQINSTIHGIKDCRTAIQDIVTSMDTLPNSVNELKSLTEQVHYLSAEHQKLVEDLENKLKAFAEMKDKATNAMPEIENNLVRLTDNFALNIDKVISNVEASQKVLSESVQQQGDNVNSMVTNVKDNIISMTGKMDETISTSMSNLEKNISAQQKNLDLVFDGMKDSLLTTITSTTESIQDGFTKQQDYLDTLTDDISKKISASTDGMDDAIEGHLKVIQTSINSQQEHINTIVDSVKDNIIKSTEGIDSVITDQITKMRESSELFIKEANHDITNMIDTLNENFENMDAQMKKELTDAVQTLTNNVTGFQKEFIQVHGKMINTIRDKSNESISTIRGS